MKNKHQKYITNKEARPNWKLISSSVIALIFIALSYLVHWTFIIPAIIFYFIGWKLMK